VALVRGRCLGSISFSFYRSQLCLAIGIAKKGLIHCVALRVSDEKGFLDNMFFTTSEVADSKICGLIYQLTCPISIFETRTEPARLGFGPIANTNGTILARRNSDRWQTDRH
jgi:hypothetical protein